MSVRFDGVFNCKNCFVAGKIGATADPNRYGTMPRQAAPPKVYTPPPPIVPAKQQDKLGVFFGTRGITEAVVERNGITLGEDGGIKFPYLRDGELVNVKTRYPGKKFAMSAGAELVFYGLDDCANAKQVVIVEGEMDKLALEVAGITAVISVPNGAQTKAMDFLASGEPIFRNCHTVILAVDNDAPGLALEEELARRIGKEVCYRVRWPDGCKDANDVLIKHGEGALRTCIADAATIPLEGVVEAKDLLESCRTYYRLGSHRGVKTGWPSVDAVYTVKPGQLTIVGGYPGSGKSEWLDNLILNLARYEGWRFAIFSPENHPLEEHLGKFAEKYLDKPVSEGPNPRMTEAEFDGFVLGFAQEHLVFSAPEEPTVEAILTTAKGILLRRGINGLVIDPWTNVVDNRARGDTVTEFIKRSLTTIQTFAKRHNVHVWIVAHPSMPLKSIAPPSAPGPHDLAGSAHWYNKADNILSVFRHKQDNDLPVEIHIQKIRTRAVGQLGVVHLRFERVTAQYHDLGTVYTTGKGAK